MSNYLYEGNHCSRGRLTSFSHYTISRRNTLESLPVLRPLTTVVMRAKPFWTVDAARRVVRRRSKAAQNKTTQRNTNNRLSDPGKPIYIHFCSPWRETGTSTRKQNNNEAKIRTFATPTKLKWLTFWQWIDTFPNYSPAWTLFSCSITTSIHCST